MKREHKKVLGLILTTVGLTLMAGGIASFFFSNVELRFFGNEVIAEKGRILWVIFYGLIGLTGIVFLRISGKRIV